MEFEGVRFPSLPSDSYRAFPDCHAQRVTSLKPLTGSSPDNISALLCLSWATVLSLYTNANDVLFGLIADSHGTGKGSEALVPCRLLLEPEDTLPATTAKIAQFQDLLPSLEQIGLTELRTMSPDAAKISTFNNLLVIRRGAGGSHAVGFLDPNGHSYALTVICTVESDRVSIHAQFDPSVLERFVVDSMLDQLAYAFDCARDRSASQVRELRAINPNDMQRIREWNNRVSLPEKGTTCVHQLVESRCRQQPSAPAVCAWDGDLTYEELNQRASRLARQLVMHHAVRPDQLVFVLTDRSMWTTIAALGALKAGAGIAFLDPSQPTHRLVTICGRAEAHLILSADKHASMARHLGPPVLTFTQVERYFAADKKEEEWQPPIVQGHHVAYATFTSGSTGEPKGVLVEHAAFTCNYTRYRELSGLTSDSRVLHGASYGFVVSILENLLTLSVGGCVCIPSDLELQESVAAAIHKYSVTWTMITPSVARTIDPAATPSLRSVLLAGEPMGRTDLRQWAGHADVYNLYAQSEFCTAMTLARKSDAEGEDEPSTLGPAVGCHTWVVDPQDHDQLMPIGAEGELVVSGPSMFRGYVNNPDQTSAALVEAPSWTQQQGHQHGLRLLKTGDLVRYNSSTGSLEYRGRKGNRVKIRGQRIELGEVEFHLRTHFPNSGNLVVDLVYPADETTAEQHPILVAFVLTSAKERIQRSATAVLGPPTPEFRLQVQRALVEVRKVLPGYMVPSAFVAVTTFPRTVSGKLSRGALCEAASKLSRKKLASYTTGPKSYRSPTTDPERVLQAVCAELLGLDLSSVGIDDNFIDLGGDSLSARRLVAMVRARGWGLSLVDCFSEPTLGHLALRAQQRGSDDNGPIPPASARDPFGSIKEEFIRNLPEGLSRDLVEDALPAREIQGLYSQEEIQDYLIWQLTGPLDVTQLRQACEALVREHPILRTIFLPYQDQCMQIVLRNVNLPFEVVRPTTASQSLDMIARSLAMQDRQTRYPTTQPIVKFTLIQAQEGSHESEPPSLMMRLSHAQYDGLSLRPLLHHLATLYTAAAQPPRTDYAGYTRRCRQLRTPQALNFWRSLLNGSTLTNLQLPQPSPEPSIPHPAEDKTLHLTRTVPLPSPFPQGITMATLIKTAWATVLHQETHSRDIVFAQIVNARDIDLPDLDTLIGPCLNIIPVRVSFPPASAPDTPDATHAILTAVQTQHAQSLEYSTCQWQEIVTQCTDWSKNGNSSPVSSIVLHENFDAKPEVDLGGGRRWKMRSPILSNPPDQTIFLTTWPERDVLSVMFSVSSRWVRREDAERLVERFCGNLAVLTG
ncbi:acetyl-CoA synthetase-like protein [Aspergillus indologenus CBS 114.80]|uniref:Acetyl-CoA synthetase-like protein n=1 Tax=Aspergillus indologenus CBS 114.80 TaxID=1450541 RepID=A0A2V5ICF8_9EURO|nr:acetyl-CoA synthetase-like protein [Aspergillus indologenus CBS 114.80]